jgi:hypothetical protein
MVTLPSKVEVNGRLRTLWASRCLCPLPTTPPYSTVDWEELTFTLVNTKTPGEDRGAFFLFQILDFP